MIKPGLGARCAPRPTCSKRQSFAWGLEAATHERDRRTVDDRARDLRLHSEDVRCAYDRVGVRRDDSVRLPATEALVHGSVVELSTALALMEHGWWLVEPVELYTQTCTAEQPSELFRNTASGNVHGTRDFADTTAIET